MTRLAFPADIGRKPESRPRRPVGAGNNYTPVRAGFAGDLEHAG